MTRRSIIEYAEAIRERYFRASKKAKTEILNEFVATTGMHRKAVIRCLIGKVDLPGRKGADGPGCMDLRR